LALAAAPVQAQDDRGATAAQLASQLTDPDIRVRYYAAYALGQLGPQAATAVGPLQKALANRAEQEYVRGTLAWALGRIGPAAEPAIPQLIEMLASKHDSVRRNAAEALGNFGPAARGAVDELLKTARDEDPMVRLNVAVALWKIQRHPKALPALLAMLRQGRDPLPYQTAVVLGSLGADAEEVTPALVEALANSDADVRRAAARSLGQIGPAALPALKKVLAGRQVEVCREAVEALGWMGSPGVSALTPALKHPSAVVRRAAARALGRLGAEARSAEAALVEAVNDSDPAVQAAAADALHAVHAP
jgi:HEAT repeat protein